MVIMTLAGPISINGKSMIKIIMHNYSTKTIQNHKQTMAYINSNSEHNDWSSY